MKRLFYLSISLVFLGQVIFSQEENQPKQFDLTAVLQKRQIEKYAETPIETNDQYVSMKLAELLTNDAFGYFDIEDLFPTPLQIKNFKNTEEYAALLNSMKEQREKLADLEFKVTIEEALSQYDTQKGGFKVNFSFSGNPVVHDNYTCNIRMCNPRGQCARQECEGNKRTNYPNAHLGFLFYEIAGKGNKAINFPWFVKVDEANGGTIESSGAKVRIVFKVGKMHTKNHKTNKAESLKLPNGYSISSKESHDMKLHLFETKIIRLEFVNSAGAVVASINR